METQSSYNYIERFLLKDKDMNWPNLHENETHQNKSLYTCSGLLYYLFWLRGHRP